MHMHFLLLLVRSPATSPTIPTKALFESQSMSRPTQRRGDANVVCHVGGGEQRRIGRNSYNFSHGAWNFNSCVLGIFVFNQGTFNDCTLYLPTFTLQTFQFFWQSATVYFLGLTFNHPIGWTHSPSFCFIAGALGGPDGMTRSKRLMLCCYTSMGKLLNQPFYCLQSH